MRGDIRAQSALVNQLWSQLLNQSSLKELDESGGYSAVEVVASPDCGAGGVIQMRQASVESLDLWS